MSIFGVSFLGDIPSETSTAPVTSRQYAGRRVCGDAEIWREIDVQSFFFFLADGDVVTYYYSQRDEVVGGGGRQTRHHQTRSRRRTQCRDIPFLA